MIEKAIGSGIYEVEVDGKTYGFKFGTLASAYTERVANMGIFKLFNEIATGKSIQALLHYFYGGAVWYAIRNKQQEPSVDDVAEWMDLIGYEKLLEIYTKSLGTYQPKNVEAPAMTEQ